MRAMSQGGNTQRQTQKKEHEYQAECSSVIINSLLGSISLLLIYKEEYKSSVAHFRMPFVVFETCLMEVPQHYGFSISQQNSFCNLLVLIYYTCAKKMQCLNSL